MSHLLIRSENPLPATRHVRGRRGGLRPKQAASGTSYAQALKAAFPDRLQPGWADFSGLVLFSTPRREPPPAEPGQEKRQLDD